MGLGGIGSWGCDLRYRFSHDMMTCLTPGAFFYFSSFPSILNSLLLPLYIPTSALLTQPSFFTFLLRFHFQETCKPGLLLLRSIEIERENIRIDRARYILTREYQIYKQHLRHGQLVIRHILSVLFSWFIRFFFS